MPFRFGRMPEYVLSKVLRGAIIMGRREYPRNTKLQDLILVSRIDRVYLKTSVKSR